MCPGSGCALPRKRGDFGKVLEGDDLTWGRGDVVPGSTGENPPSHINKEPRHAVKLSCTVI